MWEWKKRALITGRRWGGAIGRGDVEQEEKCVCGGGQGEMMTQTERRQKFKGEPITRVRRGGKRERGEEGEKRGRGKEVKKKKRKGSGQEEG